MQKSPSQSAELRIVIADDHSLMRVGIRSMLDMQSDMTVVGEAEDGQSAVKIADELRPDVIVMDLMMPLVSGAEATRQIKTFAPDTKIIILTSFGTAIEMARAIEYGADGALLKEMPSDELITAIRTVARGEPSFAAEILHASRNLSEALQLTDKQLQVLRLMVRGLTDKDIARQLDISRSGVQKHTMAIFAKLGAANRAEATSIAFETHILG